MKKAVSLTVCFCLLFCSVLPVFASVDDADGYPIIIISGYSSSDLVIIEDDGSEKKVWGLDGAGDTLSSAIGKLVLGFVRLGFGDRKYMAELCDPAIKRAMEPLRCNPDGTSVYNVKPVIGATAEEARYSNVEKYYEMATYVDDKVSYDDMYIYSCDFRLGVLDNVAGLDALIKDVLSTTGAKKVNILAQSHGGQIAATYLSIHKDDCADYIHNVVLCVPAMGGASLAYDMFMDKAEINEYSALEFAEQALFIDSDIHWLLASQPLDVLDEFVHAVMPSVSEVILNWQALWDFIPLRYFDEVVETVGDRVSPELIVKTRYFHETYMAHFHENLSAALANGVNITITAGTGTPSETGSPDNGDGIIPAFSSTGATTAPFGKRFSDGYDCVGETCADSTHNHLSPSMEVDASTCYLPENTWFIDGYYHGQETKDSYILELVRNQLISKNPIPDVHSDERYPQFHASTGFQRDVFARFDGAIEGYVTGDTESVTVTNLTDSPIVVYEIKVKGFNADFGDFRQILLPAHESASVPFVGTVPEKSKVRAALTLSFVRILGTATPIMTRTLDFTIMNGPAPAYDADVPYADADFPVFDGNHVLNDTNIGELNSAFISFFDRVKQFLERLLEFVDKVLSIIKK